MGVCGLASSLPLRRAPGHRPPGWTAGAGWTARAVNQKVDSAGGGPFSAGARPRRHYAGSMEGDAGNTVHDGTGKGAPHAGAGTPGTRTRTEPTGAAVILRVLRVSLHVGFAVLLLVAAGPAPRPAASRGTDWITLLLAAAARRLLPRGHRPGETARRPTGPGSIRGPTRPGGWAASASSGCC